VRSTMRATTAGVLIVLTGALAGCADGDTAAGAAADGGGPETLTVVTTDEDFDLTELSVPSGSEVTITYENADEGAVHNLHVKVGADGPKTELAAGLNTDELTFTVHDAGEYEFVCDAHPATMQGVLTVE
jgi:plastocyanin